MTDRGRKIHGIYLPVGKLVKWTPRQLVQWVKEVGADAVVMDIKDDWGRITFTKKIPLTKSVPRAVVTRIAKIIEAFKAADIYMIGRLVCFKDNLFYRKLPEAAIRERGTTKPWRDKKGSTWLDPYSLAAHEYISSIAQAAEEIGFDEIQLDYVRFPVEPETRYAKFSNKEGDLTRYEAIALLLARVDFQISVPLSIDVFGLTANRPGDSQGLGQSLEHLFPYVDAISPMLYVANWPKETWENASTKTIHEIVYNSVKRIRARLGDTVVVRPLLQGFNYRVTSFGTEFIHTQINAATTAGSSGHLFWNQAGDYSKVAVVWQRLQSISLPESPSDNADTSPIQRPAPSENTALLPQSADGKGRFLLNATSSNFP